MAALSSAPTGYAARGGGGQEESTPHMSIHRQKCRNCFKGACQIRDSCQPGNMSKVKHTAQTTIEASFQCPQRSSYLGRSLQAGLSSHLFPPTGRCQEFRRGKAEAQVCH